VSDDCLLPVPIHYGEVIAGSWCWNPELRSDVCPRPARREGLDHRSGEEIFGLDTAVDGISAVSVHAKAFRSGVIDERGLGFASKRL